LSVNNIDDVVKSRKAVAPAQAGAQNCMILLDSRFRGNDENGIKNTFYEIINIPPFEKGGFRGI
jgi:hypothetical protein